MGKRSIPVIRLASRIISMMMVLFLAAGTLFCDAFAMDISSEEVAVGVYDQDYDLMEQKYAERQAAPRLDAKASNFTQALVQDYRELPGTIDLSKNAGFYIVCSGEPSEELRETVNLMAGLFAEYKVLSSEKPDVAYGPYEDAGEDDIIIRLRGPGPFAADLHKWLPDADPEEAYELNAEDRIELSAGTADGIWYGLLTLLEIACSAEDDRGNISFGCFRISDAPDLRERTVFIDCARKYFSKKWLEAFIKRSSMQRYNTIVLHFSEAECVRLDSDKFPWLTEGVKSLSREEVEDIVKTAARYHMDVIPSIDTPGHNRYTVRKYEQYARAHKDFSFEYDGVTYDRRVKGFSSIANHYERDGVTLKVTDIGVDISKEHARAFSCALIKDYAEFFRRLGCSRFDICGDELMGWSNFMLGDNQVSYESRWLFLEHWQRYARKELGIRKGSPSDAFISYLNTVTGMLEDMGYECRVFNDEIDINRNQHVSLSENTGITYWDPALNSAKHFAVKGHTVYNGMMQWTYYVVRKINGKDIMKGRYKSVNAKNIFENWDPRLLKTDKLGGAYFFIWCDAPDYKSAKTIMEETMLRTWANACRMWNSEVNSDRSGIRRAMQYRHLKIFAEMMNNF